MAVELGWEPGRVAAELELWARVSALEGLVPSESVSEPA